MKPLKRMKKVAVKYELIEHPDSYHTDHWSIKILEGELEGLAFQYDTVKVEETENGEAVLNFEVMYVEGGEAVDTEDEVTSSILGDILVDIIETNMREMTENGDGNTDTETPAE